MFKKIVWLIPTYDDLFKSYASILNKNQVPITLYPYNNRCSEIGYNDFSSELREIAKEADLLLVTLWSGSHILSPYLIRTIKEDIPVVLFSLDDEIYSTHISVNYAQILDMVVSNDYFGKGIFEQLGVKTLYYPFHRYFDDFTNYNLEKDIDISFIGNLEVSDRIEYINALNDAGFKVELFGKGTKNGFLTRDKYTSTIRRSKINLNFTKVLLSRSIRFNEPWRSLSRQIKGRPFEVFCLGSFCLSEWAPASEFILGRKYKDSQFLDKKDLIEKVTYFLDNEKEREEITNDLNIYYKKNYACPNSLLNLFFDIYNKLNDKEIIKTVELVKPSIFYLQRVNKTSWNISINLLKKGKFIKATSTLFNTFDLKIFIYSLLTFPYVLIMKILKIK